MLKKYEAGKIKRKKIIVRELQLRKGREGK